MQAANPPPFVAQALVTSIPKGGVKANHNQYEPLPTTALHVEKAESSIINTQFQNLKLVLEEYIMCQQ
jgi:hypothetical protein